MKLAAAILTVLGALALCLPLPGAAQAPADNPAPAREEVLAAFTRLVDRGEARSLFGLQETVFWRRSGGLALALFAEDATALRPLLEGAAAPFAGPTGQAITVIDSGPAVAAGQDLAALAPEADLVIVIGPRLVLAEIAAAGAFNKGMLANFELGTWPFMFTFASDEGRRGVMLFADDEPARAREASFILATVWGLGGVTLGPEMTGLISDSENGPVLTPLGEAAFRLFFNDDLEVGLPLAEALRRAETLLAP